MTGGFCVNWTNELLKGLEKKPMDLDEAFRGCADFHYRFNQMDRVLEPYVGDLKGFLAFLEKDLGWAITVSDDGKTITADECKEKCVCPVSAEMTGKMSGMLCNCSAWYAIPEVSQGRRLILSNMNLFYCSDSYAEIPLRATLMYEPEIKGKKISSDNVLGVEAPMWTEWNPENEDIERQMYPRLLAVAECGWTKERSYEDFLPRAEKYLAVPALNLLRPMEWEEATIHGEKALRQIAGGILNLAAQYVNMSPVEEDEESAKVEAVVPEGSEQLDMVTMVRSYMTDKMKAAYTEEDIDQVMNMVLSAMAEKGEM